MKTKNKNGRVYADGLSVSADLVLRKRRMGDGSIALIGLDGKPIRPPEEPPGDAYTPEERARIEAINVEIARRQAEEREKRRIERAPELERRRQERAFAVAQRRAERADERWEEERAKERRRAAREALKAQAARDTEEVLAVMRARGQIK